VVKHKGADTMKWYPVRVYMNDDIFEDEIQGENEVLAIDNALWNWENAEYIEIIK
jgi:hypothetical protein